jgi:hypothetical protein
MRAGLYGSKQLKTQRPSKKKRSRRRSSSSSRGTDEWDGGGERKEKNRRQRTKERVRLAMIERYIACVA